MKFFAKKNNTPKVVYSHDYFYSIDDGPLFDVMRFKKIRDRLITMKILRRKDILIPEMVAYDELHLVHTPAYVQSIRDPMQVARFLKLEHVDPFDSRILEYFRIVTGGTLLATDYALGNRTIVFNLGGGFHHAHREKGGGYCLINDIAIAREKYCNQLRCLIVDLDYHQGDGNLAIYEKNPHVFTFSMHAGYWLESSKTENLDILLPEYCDGNEYLRILSSTLPDLINTFDPQFIFYIAGSDPYIYDTLGDLALTRADMLRRNMFVFSLLKEKNIPGVVLAGGGYGDRSWEVYFDFISHSLRYRK